MNTTVDLSSYAGETVSVSWEQGEEGYLESTDSLQYALSLDGGTNWSSLFPAFNNDNPASGFSATIPNEYLTSNFKMRFYLGDFSGTGEYCYIDDVKISLADGNFWEAGADWEIYSGQFRGYHDGAEADKYLTMISSLDLSSHTGELITVNWEQYESGYLESSDTLKFSVSNDGGVNWSDMVTAFNDDNPYETFSYTLTDEYLTSGFRIRFYLEEFSGSSEYAYIDNLSVTEHDIQVDRAMFNGQEISADEQQFVENDDREYTVGTWSYSCRYDASNMIDDMIDSEEITANGEGTYTFGHVLEERAGYPGYSFSLYPDEITGYPLGTPAPSEASRYQYSYAGWSLILIYVSPETKGHQMYLFDDFAFVGHTNVNIPVSGFVTPEDPEGSRMTCFVGEGDYRYTGDYLEINDTRLSDAVNPVNNVWNSYSNALDDTEMEGIDLDTFDVSAYIDPGDTSAEVEVGSDSEIFNVVYVILSFRSNTTIGSSAVYLISD